MANKKTQWSVVDKSTIVEVILNPQKHTTATGETGVSRDEESFAGSNMKTELVVCEPEVIFNAFDGLNSARHLYLESKEGYERMREFLRGTMFDARTPIIEHHELDPRNAFNPVVPGFDKDRRVIAKCAKSMRYSVYSGFGRDCNGDIYESYVELERPIKYLFKRDYDFNPDKMSVTPCRIPIFLSGQREGVDRFAGLAFEIMCHQLEPVTSQRINRRLNNRWVDFTKKGLATLITVGLYEEAVIATGITRYWLNSTAENNGFNLSEISRFNPYEIHTEDAEHSFLQTQTAGINKVLDFYQSREWDVREYLNGKF